MGAEQPVKRVRPDGRTEMLTHCARCGIPVWKLPSLVAKRKPYCSRRCAGTANGVLRTPLKGGEHPSWKGGVSADRALWQRLQHEKFPEKTRARAALKHALKTGKIVRQPCEKCGAKKVHGHHEDYSKPLQVRWLCRKHHDEEHGK